MGNPFIFKVNAKVRTPSKISSSRSPEVRPPGKGPKILLGENKIHGSCPVSTFPCLDEVGGEEGLKRGERDGTVHMTGF